MGKEARRLRFLAFGCPHVPLADDSAIAWLLKRIREYKPQVILHLGDGHEACSASRWPHEYEWTLTDEFTAHNKLLENIRKAAPKARRVFCWGNHDANLLAINRIDRQLRNLCDPRAHEPELRGWQHIPYIYCRKRGVFRLGQVTFGHGYEHGVSADEFHSYLLGVPYGLYVGAHTHRPVEVTQAMRTKAVPLPYWYCNVGCLRDLKPPYVERQRTYAWGHALVVGEAQPTKSPRMTRCWDAHLEVYQMYNDWAA